MGLTFPHAVLQSTSLLPTTPSPLDSRLVVDKLDDLINPNLWEFVGIPRYEGQIVSVIYDNTEANNGVYYLRSFENKNTIGSQGWKKISDNTAESRSYADSYTIIGQGTLIDPFSIALVDGDYGAKIQLRRTDTFLEEFLSESFQEQAYPWFLFGEGRNQLYVDGVCINPHIKPLTGLTIDYVPGNLSIPESYYEIGLQLSNLQDDTLGNSLELITTGSTQQLGLFSGYSLFVGEEGSTASEQFVGNQDVWLHLLSHNGKNHNKVKLVGGVGTTVTASNNIISIGLLPQDIQIPKLYNLLGSNYWGTELTLYNPLVENYQINVIGGLKFLSDGQITSLTDTKHFILGDSSTSINNSIGTDNLYVNFVGENNNNGVMQVYSSLNILAGTNIALSANDGCLTIHSSAEDTHYTSRNIVTGFYESTNETEVATNGVFLNHLEDSEKTSSTYIFGSNGVKVFSNNKGWINICGTRLVVSSTPTGISDTTNFTGDIYLNLVGDADSDDMLEVLDSVKLTSSGATSLSVNNSAKTINFNSEDTNTTYELSLGLLDQNTAAFSIEEGVKKLLKSKDESISFSEVSPIEDGVYIDVAIVDGGTF